MSFEEKQIHKLTKQLHAKEEQHKKQKGMMIQKIQLLQSQMMDYQEKDMKNRQLNQSIMMSYKQNESFRQQCKDKELNSIMQRHQQQIKNLKKRHSQQKKQLQEQINNLKCVNDKLRLDIEKLNLENQKQIAQIKHSYEEKINDKNMDMSNIFQHKFDVINQRLRQSQQMNAFFKNQLESKKDKLCSNNEKEYLNIDQAQERVIYFEKENKKKPIFQKNNFQNEHILKKNQSTISSINLRINRALVQLNPNKAQINDRIRKIREKIYDY